jgi:uncharacterized phage-associated protein
MLDLRKYQEFNIEKIIQVLAYIQRKANIFDKLALIKLLFFADRLHLRRYFSLISQDIYYALRNGPAASNALNVINKYEDYLDITNPMVSSFLKKIELVDTANRKIDENNVDLMSKNEVKTINFICEKFGTFTSDILVELTHDYPEWKRYETLFLQEELAFSAIIKIEDFFTNPDMDKSPALQKYFNGIDPLYEDLEYLNEVKSFYLTNKAIKNYEYA